MKIQLFFSIVILPPIKYCVTLCQFYSISSPFLLIKTKKIWNEKIFCMYGCFSISYIKEVKYHIFWYNHVLRCTCIYKQPILTKSSKMIFCCKFYLYSYLRYTDMFSLLLAVILSELHEKPRRKDWVTELKST